MNPDEARRRFAAARVARLATADPSARPHLVPIVFALTGNTLYSAVDTKPKRRTALRRLINVEANPVVSILVDHYEEDWTALWWVRADGDARVLAPGTPEAAQALVLLRGKYPHYRHQPPPGPVLAVEVRRWSGWTSGG